MRFARMHLYAAVYEASSRAKFSEVFFFFLFGFPTFLCSLRVVGAVVNFLARRKAIHHLQNIPFNFFFSRLLLRENFPAEERALLFFGIFQCVQIALCANALGHNLFPTSCLRLYHSSSCVDLFMLRH